MKRIVYDSTASPNAPQSPTLEVCLAEPCLYLQSPVEASGRGQEGRGSRRPHCHSRNAMPRKGTSIVMLQSYNVLPSKGDGMWLSIIWRAGGLSRGPWHSSLILPYNSEESQFPEKQTDSPGLFYSC